MCISFDPPSKELVEEYFGVMPPPDEWPPTAWQDYPAPIIIGREDRRVAVTASYGLIPQKRKPPNVKKLTTMNARAETIGELRSYKRPWADGQLCLVPMTGFYEPNYEQEHLIGKSERWRIWTQDGKPFAVAGIWQAWDRDTDTPQYSFTQITVNADEHPFMGRFHKKDDEKRSLVIVRPEDYDNWLHCRNPEVARTFFQLYPAELMRGEPKKEPPRKPKVKKPDFEEPTLL